MIKALHYSATSSEAFDDRHVQFIEQPQDRSSSSDKKNRSFLFYQFSAEFAYYKMNTKRKKREKDYTAALLWLPEKSFASRWYSIDMWTALIKSLRQFEEWKSACNRFVSSRPKSIKRCVQYRYVHTNRDWISRFLFYSIL